MAGRPRLPVSTFGSITTVKVGPDRYRATARFRDWDGQTRKVTSMGSSRSAAEAALKIELAARTRVSDGSDSLTADSPFEMLRRGTPNRSHSTPSASAMRTTERFTTNASTCCAPR